MVNKSSIFNVQEYDNACYIVNDAFFFPPSLEGSSHQVFSCSLGILLEVEWVNYLSHINVFKELPNTITSDNDHLVFFGEGVLVKLWDGIATDRVSHAVAERSGHCEPGHVLALQPDSEGTEWVAVLVSVRIYSSIVGEDPLCFVFVVWLVIPTERSAGASLRIFGGAVGPDDDASRVTYVCDVELAANCQDTHAG